MNKISSRYLIYYSKEVVEMLMENMIFHFLKLTENSLIPKHINWWKIKTVQCTNLEVQQYLIY